MFQEIRGLSQAVLQNGGSLHDIIELYSTNSVRQMKKVFKTLKDRQEELQNQEMQQKQQAMEQQQQQAEAALNQAQEQYESKIANDNYQAELDRINKKEIALIAAESKSGPLSDVDVSGTPDVLEISKLNAEESRASKDYEAKLEEIRGRDRQHYDKMQIEREKMQVDLKNQDNDLEIARINAKNRASKNK
jgi:hypothetical protein